MSEIRFFLTPGAIRDFREIYAYEGLTKREAAEALQSSAKEACWELTRPEGSQVLRSQGSRSHYLLVGEPGRQGQPVFAVASLDNQDPQGWWLQNGKVPPHPGAELRFAREALGLSTEQLSSLLRQPQHRIEAWERGQIGSWKRLRKIARLVGKLHEFRVMAHARKIDCSKDRRKPGHLLETHRGGHFAANELSQTNSTQERPFNPTLTAPVATRGQPPGDVQDKVLSQVPPGGGVAPAMQASALRQPPVDAAQKKQLRSQGDF